MAAGPEALLGAGEPLGVDAPPGAETSPTQGSALGAETLPTGADRGPEAETTAKTGNGLRGGAGAGAPAAGIALPAADRGRSVGSPGSTGGWRAAAAAAGWSFAAISRPAAASEEPPAGTPMERPHRQPGDQSHHHCRGIGDKTPGTLPVGTFSLGRKFHWVNHEAGLTLRQKA